MLMESGKPTEALAAYEQSYAQDPNRYRSLYGAGLLTVKKSPKVTDWTTGYRI